MENAFLPRIQKIVVKMSVFFMAIKSDHFPIKWVKIFSKSIITCRVDKKIQKFPENLTVHILISRIKVGIFWKFSLFLFAFARFVELAFILIKILPGCEFSQDSIKFHFISLT